jgi:formylglycine-generating enzyme required for sulfatase activity
MCGDGVSGSCVIAMDAGVGSDAAPASRGRVASGCRQATSAREGLSTAPRAALPRCDCSDGSRDSMQRGIGQCAWRLRETMLAMRRGSPERAASSCLRVIPGGVYYRSYDLAGDPSSGDKSFPATVSSFRLDKYEVTVQRFRAFVAEGMGTQASHPAMGSGAHANIAASGWEAGWNASLVPDVTTLVADIKCDPVLQTWTDPPAANEDRPMNCITWYEAMAFCVWDGGYLPTEAEWNYAAAGGDQQRAYPWSASAAPLALDSTYASYSDGSTCVGDGMSGCALTDLVPVGTKPAGNGRWGHADMAGSVLEWTLDWSASYATPCTDCAEFVPSSARITRGGAFATPAASLRTGFRQNTGPLRRSSSIGVRCARTP